MVQLAFFRSPQWKVEVPAQVVDTRQHLVVALRFGHRLCLVEQIEGFLVVRLDPQAFRQPDPGRAPLPIVFRHLQRLLVRLQGLVDPTQIVEQCCP